MAENPPDNLVLQLLREMRADMATKDDIAKLGAELRSEVRSLRADVASDIHNLDAKIDGTRKEMSEQIVGLRRAVIGNIIADLEARIRRVEQRLGLEDAH